MTIWSVVTKNALRNKGRNALTIVGAASAVLVFIMLRTVLSAWNAGAEYAAKDRLSTRNKVSFGLPLPKRYVTRIAQLPFVQHATYCDWFGGRLASDPTKFFANLACADDAFEAYPELRIEPDVLTRWRSDRQGAILGDQLAAQLGVHVGDKLVLQGSFYPGDWPLTVSGTYSVPRHSALSRSSMFLRWIYKNERVPAAQREQVGWIFTRVDDPTKAARVTRAIDALFEHSDVRTITASERGANAALVGGVSALLAALDLMSALVLAIMALILGNSLAMGVRERTREYAILRAMGFAPSQIQRLIVAEGTCLAGVAALLGLASAFPLIQIVLGGFLELHVGEFFPTFVIAPSTLLMALLGSLLLGALASLLPALRVSRMPVGDALRVVT